MAGDARVYPSKLAAAILKGLKEQMKIDGVISEAEPNAVGRVCEMTNEVYWDTVNGGFLGARLGQRSEARNPMGEKQKFTARCRGHKSRGGSETDHLEVGRHKQRR